MRHSLFEAIKGYWCGIDCKRGFGELDRSVLVTMMMLSAVDGEVGESERSFFRQVAETCRGFSETSFAAIWDAALRETGYIYLQSHLLERPALVALFVDEAEKSLIKALAMEPTAERERAIGFLERMASADGDYSEVERQCVTALVRRLGEVRTQLLCERFSRSAMYGNNH